MVSWFQECKCIDVAPVMGFSILEAPDGTKVTVSSTWAASGEGFTVGNSYSVSIVPVTSKNEGE